MQRYEYKVVPAPNRGEKVRGLKTSDDRFAHTLGALMNDLGREGWEYMRTDTLPTEERSGLTRRTTVYHNMLVFRRPSVDAMQAELIQSVSAEPPAAIRDDTMTQAPRKTSVLPSAATIGQVARKLSAHPSEGTAPPISGSSEGSAPKVGPAPGKDVAAE